MDEKKLNLTMTILKVVLVVIGVIATALVVFGPNGNSEVKAQEEFLESASLALAINYTLYIVFGGIAIILIFFLVQLVTNTKKTALSITGILAALLLYLIFWGAGTSDTNESLALMENVQVEDGVISTTSAGIYTAIVMVSVGFLVWILGPLMGRYRK